MKVAICLSVKELQEIHVGIVGIEIALKILAYSCLAAVQQMFITTYVAINTAISYC